jgi:hypothetical protein
MNVASIRLQLQDDVEDEEAEAATDHIWSAPHSTRRRPVQASDEEEHVRERRGDA